MPVEIRELVIRAVVDPGQTATQARQPVSEEERAALIQACVEETLRVLRRERER